MNIAAAYTRWADRYDSDRNLTRDLIGPSRLRCWDRSALP